MKTPRPIKKIGRKRRTLGWMLFTLGVLVAGVWVWSGCSPKPIALLPSADYEATEVFAGRLWVTRVRDFAPPRGDAFKRSMTLLEDEHQKRRQGGWFVSYGIYGTDYANTTRRQRRIRVYALWPIPLLLWTPAALLLRSGIIARRRANAGVCAKCGYSLAGLAADAPCPECGKGAKAIA